MADAVDFLSPEALKIHQDEIMPHLRLMLPPGTPIQTAHFNLWVLEEIVRLRKAAKQDTVKAEGLSGDTLLMTASGPQLDAFGCTFGVFRKIESDESLRKRIIAEVEVRRKRIDAAMAEIELEALRCDMCHEWLEVIDRHARAMHPDDKLCRSCYQVISEP